MELKDFVAKSIEDVVNGILDATNKTSGTGAIINPSGWFATQEGMVTYYPTDKTSASRLVQSEDKTTQANRLKFSVPIIFP